MANQLLSILELTLTGIAAAIKEKAGLSSSTKLSFPTGMINAINAIETEANITPKITGKTDYLTTSKKSVPIDAGFHDGTGSVKIRLQSKSATPSASQQNITPDSGYFLSSVSVGGIGSGVRVAVGTVDKNTESSYTITCPFAPTRCIVMLVDAKGRTGSTVCISSLTKFSYSTKDKHNPGSYISGGTYSTPFLSATTMRDASVSGKTITVRKSAADAGYGKHYGKYLYVAWDGDP